MKEKGVYALFKEKREKYGNSKRALVEMVHVNLKWFRLKLVKKDLDYQLMYRISKGVFYQQTQDPILRVIRKGDFYRKERESEVPHVRKIRELKQHDVDQILEGLEVASSQREVQRIMIPNGYFIFQFKAKTGQDEIIMGGRDKTLVLKADKLDEAIQKLKERLKGMKEGCFKDFLFFQNNFNRQRILRTKRKGEWLPKEYIMNAEFRVIS